MLKILGMFEIDTFKIFSSEVQIFDTTMPEISAPEMNISETTTFKI